MALRVMHATANMSAGGDTVTNTTTLNAATNVTLGAGNTFTATFTAPNTTNKATGIAIYVVTVGSGGANTFTATLVESGVNKNTVSFDASLLKASSWNFIDITDYTFTTTGAGAYKWNLQDTSVTPTVVAQSTTAGAPAYLSADDRQITGATDDCFVMGNIANAGATTITVTFDTTALQCGSGAATTVPTNGRSIQCGLIIGAYGKVAASTTASSTLTFKGQINVCNGGELDQGTIGSALSASYYSKLVASNTASGDFGVIVNAGGKRYMSGAVRGSTTLWKTKYASGNGTSGTPLVTADTTGWAVNDQIVVGPTNGSGQTEYKFIKTISGTSITTSDTAGGVESGLANTHTTDAWILNIERNCVVSTDNVARAVFEVNQNTVAGNYNCQWGRLEYGGLSATNNKEGWDVSNAASVTGSLDYCVAYKPIGRGISFDASKVTETHTGLVVVGSSNATSTVGGIQFGTQANNKTLVDCFAIDCKRSGFWISTGGSTFTRCYIIDCNKDAIATLGGFTSNICINNNLNSCEIHLSGVQGFFGNNAIGTVFTSCLFGTKGSNTIDVAVVTDNYEQMTFIGCTLGSATPLSNYLNAAPGSKFSFDTIDGLGTTYEAAGYYTKETTEVKNGLAALKFYPQDANSALIGSFSIPVLASSAVSYSVWVVTNSSYGASNLPFARLSGAGMTTNTATFSNTNKTVTNATNASPIVITVAGHGYSNGDRVLIDSVGGNTAANGSWDIANVTANTFELVGSTGNAAYTAGGAATKWQQLTVTGTPTYKSGALVEYVAQAASGNAYFDSGGLASIELDTGSGDFMYRGDLFPTVLSTSLSARDDWNLDPYIGGVTEAQANALTGIAVDFALGTITITSSHSVNDIYCYVKARARALDKVRPFTTSDGNTYISTADITISGAIQLTGTGKTINAGSKTITLSGGATSVPILIDTTGTRVNISITGIVSGSRIQLYDSTATSELANAGVSGTTYTYSFLHTGVDHTIRLRLAYVSGTSTAYQWYTATGTVTTTGLSITAAQATDQVYIDNNYDGSTATEFSVSGTTIEIFINTGTGTDTLPHAYNWYMYLLTTASGIRDQDGAYFEAIDTAHYIFNSGMKIKNINAAALTITGGIVKDNTGSVENCIDTTGANIYLIPSNVETYGSTFTTSDRTQLNKALTVGKFLALK